jgi:hypothetical protein
MKLYFITINGVRVGAPMSSEIALNKALYSETNNPAHTGKTVSFETVESECGAIDEGEGCLFCTS